ncbi:hypothetical protein H2203_002390 [Taxawa tesnikishii (nom. ined.)]|nr:hypothetical protein H2203_002390 [Dothideales sp. JES 119]
MYYPDYSLTAGESASLKDAFQMLVDKGEYNILPFRNLVTTEPVNPPQWLSACLMSSMNAAFLARALNVGTRDWSATISMRKRAIESADIDEFSQDPANAHLSIDVSQPRRKTQRLLRERTDLSRLNAIHAGLDDPLVSLTVNRPTSTQPPTLQPPTAPRLDLPRNISDEALDLRLRSSASVTTDARSLPDPAGSAFTAAPSGSSKYAKMKGAELVALLDDRKLRNWDKKADMIERLEKYDRDNAGSAPAPSLQLVQIADADGGRTDEEYDSGDDDYEPDAQEELQLSVIDVMASGAVYGPGEDPVRREVQQEVLEAARNYGISQHTAVLASAGLMGTAEEFNHRVSRINIHTPCRNPQLVSTYLTNHSDSRDSPPCSSEPATTR